MDDGRLEHDLAAAVDGEVRFDAGTRAAYSTDASNFRQVPIGVVLPRTVDAAVTAVAVCRKHGCRSSWPSSISSSAMTSPRRRRSSEHST